MDFSNGSSDAISMFQPGRRPCPGCRKTMEISTESMQAEVSLSCSHRWCRSCVGIATWTCTECQNALPTSDSENNSITASLSALSTIKISQAEHIAEHMVKSQERWSSCIANSPGKPVYVCEYCQQKISVRFVIEKHKLCCPSKLGFSDTGSTGSPTQPGEDQDFSTAANPEDVNENSSGSSANQEEAVNLGVPVIGEKRKRKRGKSLLPVQCLVCSLTLSRKFSLQRHMLKVHPEIGSDDPKREALCQQAATIITKPRPRRRRSGKIPKLDPDLIDDSNHSVSQEATPETTELTTSNEFKVPSAWRFSVPDCSLIDAPPLHNSTPIHG